MPDFKSELQKLADLKFDDDADAQTAVTSEPVVAHADTLGVSETFFNIIRDNPGSTKVRLMALARSAGLKDSSASSLVVQFHKRGLIRAQDVNGVYGYFAAGSHYTRGYLRRAKPVKAKPVVKVTPKTIPLPHNAKFTATVPQLLDTLSIVQARELYDALKKIFGA